MRKMLKRCRNWPTLLAKHLFISVSLAMDDKRTPLLEPEQCLPSHVSQFRQALRLRGIMIGRHFHGNMKVQTATCKDNNNSKSRAVRCLQFNTYKIILVDYIQCIKHSIFSISVGFRDIKFHQSLKANIKLL